MGGGGVPVGRMSGWSSPARTLFHDFFVPSFRVKMERGAGQSIPGVSGPRSPDAPTSFVQYCGTNHALMAGWVNRLDNLYAAWLS